MTAQDLSERFAQSKHAFSQKEFHKARDILRSAEVRIHESLTVRQHGKAFMDSEHCQASIVILSYRDDNLISEALSRVAAQLADDFEVILVSNGNPRLEARGRAMFDDFKFLDMPLNVGCSMGRNIAARHAKGKWLVFLEDDGLIEAGCIAALLDCATQTGAVVVRGKYRSRTADPRNDPPHYDLGKYRRFAFMNCEGVSCVRREEFLLFDGFDPVLVGHEGVELCARMWRFYGPRAFVYEPDAVMLHDYAASKADIKAKQKRQAAFKEYVDVVTPNAMDLHIVTLSTGRLTEATAAVSSLNARFASLPGQPKMPKISVLTTARDGAMWLPDYLQCWSRQDYENFEVVFVDDGSSDNTLEWMQRAAQTDDRFVVIKGAGDGRSAALNCAIENATGEILAIADVDDVSPPDRLLLTAKYFLTHPEVDLLSFTVYGERFMNWIGGRPRDNRFSDLATRCLLGMPGRFPTFAFRKEFAVIPFDPALSAGIDCEWVCKNLAVTPFPVGRSLPIPLTYYRQHGHSISSNRLAEQNKVRDAAIRFCFERLIGPLNEQDEVFIAAINKNTAQDAEFDRFAYLGWVERLLQLNDAKRCFDPQALEYTLTEGFKDLGAGGMRPQGQPSNKPVMPTGPYQSARAVITQIRQARANGHKVQSLRMLRQFRKGARGLIVLSVQAETSAIWRRFRNGLKRVARWVTFQGW